MTKKYNKTFIQQEYYSDLETTVLLRGSLEQQEITAVFISLRKVLSFMENTSTFPWGLNHRVLRPYLTSSLSALFCSAPGLWPEKLIRIKVPTTDRGFFLHYAPKAIPATSTPARVTGRAVCLSIMHICWSKLAYVMQAKKIEIFVIYLAWDLGMQCCTRR